MTKPRLTTLKPRLASNMQQARTRTVEAGSWRATKATAAQRGYGADWQRVRHAHLLAHPHCVMCMRDSHVPDGLSPVDVVLWCAERGIREPVGNIGDHIIPHRGDDRLRLDPSNIQTLCKPHHDGEKARSERRMGYR